MAKKITKQIVTIKWTDKDGNQGSQTLTNPYLTANGETGFFCIMMETVRRKEREFGEDNVTVEDSYVEV